jgi:DNA-binding ferritin-like protein
MKLISFVLVLLFAACSGSQGASQVSEQNKKMDRMTERQSRLGQDTQATESSMDKEALMEEIRLHKQAKSEALKKDSKPSPEY